MVAHWFWFFDLVVTRGHYFPLSNETNWRDDEVDLDYDRLSCGCWISDRVTYRKAQMSECEWGRYLQMLLCSRY